MFLLLRFEQKVTMCETIQHHRIIGLSNESNESNGLSSHIQPFRSHSTAIQQGATATEEHMTTMPQTSLGSGSRRFKALR